MPLYSSSNVLCMLSGLPAIWKHPAKKAGVFESRTSVLTQRLAVVLPSPSPLDSGPVSGTGQAFDRRNDELRGRNDEGMPRMTNERLLERSIPDPSPGHAFIAIAHPGWRRHTKV